MILRGINVTENRPVAKDAAFWRDLKAGIHFVAKKPCYWRWPQPSAAGNFATTPP
jgi:hypothetical protein